MKKAARIFIKVGTILAIICLIASVIVGAIYIIAGIGDMAYGTAQSKNAIVEKGVIELVTGIVWFLVLVACGIASLILLGKARRALTLPTKAEARGGAVCAIVSGVLFTVFGIPAGILMLVMSDAQWEQKAEEPVAEEPKAE